MGLKRFLPWHEPKRQAVTTGWWGWFPSIPRNTVGRVCWVLIVGGISVLFGWLTVVLWANAAAANPIEPGWLNLLFGVVLLPARCLSFVWSLIEGIALARAEGTELRELRTEARQAAARVEEARRRVSGRIDGYGER